jgi:hypothetical protein
MVGFQLYSTAGAKAMVSLEPEFKWTVVWSMMSLPVTCVLAPCR